MARISDAEVLAMAERLRRPYAELRRLAPLTECSSAELARFDMLATTVDVPLGHRLLAEGTAARQWVLVRSGYASVTRGRDPIATIGPGDCVGHEALLQRRDNTETVTALSQMTVLVLDARGFVSAVRDMPALARRLGVPAAAGVDAETGAACAGVSGETLTRMSGLGRTGSPARETAWRKRWKTRWCRVG